MDLAVAVELIAEDVGQQHHSGLQLADRGRQRRFVDFEQADVRPRLTVEAGLFRHRADQASKQVRAGPIVEGSHLIPTQQVGDQARGRRLAVGAGNHHAAQRQAAHDVRERVRCDARDDVPRNDGPATETEAPTQTRRGAPGQ